MKEKINIIINNINRLLSNVNFSYSLYASLAIFLFFVIGLFGIVPSTKILVSNITLASNMNKNNVMLSNKLTELKNTEKDLAKVSNNIFFLENYLPDNLNMQNYLIDFVFAAGGGDFIVERVTLQNEDDSVIDLAVNVIGNGDVTRLIKNLESLNRVTEIQSLNVTKGTEYITLSMLIKTFIMEKQ